jgi:outer membrane protein assembly factor BamA
MRALLLIASLSLVMSPPLASAQEPEPATREEQLRLEREEKGRQLTPPQPSGLERLLMSLENGRLFERLLNPAQGIYPKIGNVTAGSGIAFGPAYREPGLFGGQADLSAFAAGSFKQYWMIETRLDMPRIAAGRVSAGVRAQRYDFPEEDFFGLGPDSSREDQVTFGLRNTVVGATGAVHPTRWLTFGAGVDYMAPRTSGSGDGRTLSERFDATEAPGLGVPTDFMRYEAVAAVNYREPRGNPRRGGYYGVTLQQFDDTDTGLYSFRRFEADMQQYIPLLRDRRVLALHALVSMSDADEGAQVPFYLQRTLGGPDDLRGFRRFRFRDENMLLLQAEYRWEIFTAVDGAIFYDAGKVASSRDDLDLDDLETDYGIGFRFGTSNGVFLRVEGAFGSSGGKHFIMRFGHVF